ncbi:MAG TPA: ammonium transporter [Verrucomicrobiales bacterium]|nr:ammonium transporter [Verrucomicrobiales bacterium]
MSRFGNPSRWLFLLSGAAAAFSCGGGFQVFAATADEAMAAANAAQTAATDSKFVVDNLWILIAAALVFVMHLGFASLESGLTQHKNTVNVLFKNTFIICVGILTYAVIGFNTHYPGIWWDADAGAVAAGAAWNGILSIGGFIGYPAAEAAEHVTSQYNNYTYWSDFIFQAMFAATAATIVSGAVAERVKLPSFMIFATLLVALAYPVVGSWHWGTGILAKYGFTDFAGSTMVHAFGGFAALACVLVLGPRRGKYTRDGIKPILGHSMPLAVIGVFLLWLGWYGFNGGSVLSADPAGVSLVFVTTSLAAAAGCMGAIGAAWVFLRKPDLSMALNGILAGLVGITAGANILSPALAILVGMIAGVIVVFSIVALDRLKIDDPVGAISVHGICGVWGTLACVLGGKSIASQALGIGVVCGSAFLFSLAVFLALKFTLGVRVAEEEEAEGLDVREHGSPAYATLAASTSAEVSL